MMFRLALIFGLVPQIPVGLQIICIFVMIGEEAFLLPLQIDIMPCPCVVCETSNS